MRHVRRRRLKQLQGRARGKHAQGPTQALPNFSYLFSTVEAKDIVQTGRIGIPRGKDAETRHVVGSPWVTPAERALLYHVTSFSRSAVHGLVRGGIGLPWRGRGHPAAENRPGRPTGGPLLHQRRHGGPPLGPPLSISPPLHGGTPPHPTFTAPPCKFYIATLYTGKILQDSMY